MSENIRRWIQFAAGVAVIAFALRYEHDSQTRLELVGFGCLLIDFEHTLKAIGLWKGSSSSEEAKP
jgi:hypothetical protein